MSPETVWFFLRFTHYSALALWILGIFFFAFIFAPAVHRSMASKAIAGQIVSLALRRLNLLELISFLLLMVTIICARQFIPGDPRALCSLFALTLVMGAATLFYTFSLTPRMENLKESPGFEALPATSPERQEFSRLHRLYTRLTALNLLLGVVLLFGSLLLLK